MTRHQKNATASTVYTYYERKKDQKASGYGTLEERLPKESVKSFNCCCLTLQPCVEPVVTPDGFLYEKEAILEYILRCKKENAKRMKAYENQQLRKQAEEEERHNAENERRKKRFINAESTPAHVSIDEEDEATTSINSTATVGSKRKHVRSFWIPSLNEENVPHAIDKPDMKIYCPMSGKVLKFKDLTAVKFATANIDGEVKFLCAVSNDILTNSTPCAVLKTSGNVVTIDCVENVIKKDWIDPTNGRNMTEQDIILLQRGGTGFAAVNTNLKAKIARPVLELQ